MTTAREYVRRYYGVPAKRGMRVIADGKPGVITSFRDARINVRLDGEKRPAPWHPTWHMVYLAPDGTELYRGTCPRPCYVRQPERCTIASQ